MSAALDQLDHFESTHPSAVVNGEPLQTWPADLYIPPDALEVILEQFSGPLDLLLYLIKRHNLDILNIPMAKITQQYLQYIELMQQLQIELAADYLLMAALLAEIKSRLLLPKPANVEEEDDPRAELIKRLQEYERFKHVAEKLDELPRYGRDIFSAEVPFTPVVVRAFPQVTLQEVCLAFSKVMQRASLYASHQVQKESLSVRERMTIILNHLKKQSRCEFTHLFKPSEGRMGVVVTFVALLELLKQNILVILQAQPYSVIYVEVSA